MSSIKLFGETSKKTKKGEKGRLKRIALPILSVLFALECLYFIFTYSNIPFIAGLRHMTIETAMSTMRNQWVATMFFPAEVVDEVMTAVDESRNAQVGINSTWEQPPLVPSTSVTARQEVLSLFREIDEGSLDQWLKEHPEALENGWENFYVNASGLDDDGTGILTTQGDEILAIDVPNQILLIRVSDIGYRGVLAIAKDPSRLSVRTSSKIGTDGELVGEIAEQNDGVLALTASCFQDIDIHGNVGKGNGGIVAGLSVSNGTIFGKRMGHGFKRIELRKDNLFYVVDSESPLSEDCTDAAEFTPALIVDGEMLVDEGSNWNAINPRACIGQNSNGEIMMLCIEGRQLTSLGIGVLGCAEILARYDCMQALNLDGGTSAIMWYDGQCVTRCCNAQMPEGRPLPNAFVYARNPVPDPTALSLN